MGGCNQTLPIDDLYREFSERFGIDFVRRVDGQAENLILGGSLTLGPNAVSDIFDDLQTKIEAYQVQSFEPTSYGFDLVCRNGDRVPLDLTAYVPVRVTSQSLVGTILRTELSDGVTYNTDLTQFVNIDTRVVSVDRDGDSINVVLSDGVSFSVDLADYTNTDTKVASHELVEDNLILSMTDGQTFTTDLSVYKNTDTKLIAASLQADELLLALVDGTEYRVDLSKYTNTDTTLSALSLNGDTLSALLSDGRQFQVDLSKYENTDTRVVSNSLTGDTLELVLSNGVSFSVDLSKYANVANVRLQSASLDGSVVKLLMSDDVELEVDLQRFDLRLLRHHLDGTDLVSIFTDGSEIMVSLQPLLDMALAADNPVTSQEVVGSALVTTLRDGTSFETELPGGASSTIQSFSLTDTTLSIVDGAGSQFNQNLAGILDGVASITFDPENGQFLLRTKLGQGIGVVIPDRRITALDLDPTTNILTATVSTSGGVVEQVTVDLSSLVGGGDQLPIQSFSVLNGVFRIVDGTGQELLADFRGEYDRLVSASYSVATGQLFIDTNNDQVNAVIPTIFAASFNAANNVLLLERSAAVDFEVDLSTLDVRPTSLAYSAAGVLTLTLSNSETLTSDISTLAIQSVAFDSVSRNLTLTRKNGGQLNVVIPEGTGGSVIFASTPEAQAHIVDDKSMSPRTTYDAFRQYGIGQNSDNALDFGVPTNEIYGLDVSGFFIVAEPDSPRAIYGGFDSPTNLRVSPIMNIPMGAGQTVNNGDPLADGTFNNGDSFTRGGGIFQMSMEPETNGLYYRFIGEEYDLNGFWQRLQNTGGVAIDRFFQGSLSSSFLEFDQSSKLIPQLFLDTPLPKVNYPFSQDFSDADIVSWGVYTVEFDLFIRITDRGGASFPRVAIYLIESLEPVDAPAETYAYNTINFTDGENPSIRCRKTITCQLKDNTSYRVVISGTVGMLGTVNSMIVNSQEAAMFGSTQGTKTAVSSIIASRILDSDKGGENYSPQDGGLESGGGLDPGGEPEPGGPFCEYVDTPWSEPITFDMVNYPSEIGGISVLIDNDTGLNLYVELTSKSTIQEFFEDVNSQLAGGIVDYLIATEPRPDGAVAIQYRWKDEVINQYNNDPDKPDYTTETKTFTKRGLFYENRPEEAGNNAETSVSLPDAFTDTATATFCKEPDNGPILT